MRRISEYVDRLPYVEGAEDAMGVEVESWGLAETVGIFAFDPGGSVVTDPARGAIITTPTLYLPFNPPFRPHDKCVARGETYLVEGEPADWQHPRIGAIGSVVHLRRVDG